MQLGVFAKTFTRTTVEEMLDAVVAHKLDCIQFNFSSAGLESLPDKIDPSLAKRIGTAVRKRGICMAGVSGTFNMIHPDPKQRADGFRRLEAIAASCQMIGTNLITLCTGTRDPAATAPASMTSKRAPRPTAATMVMAVMPSTPITASAPRTSVASRS